MYEMNELLPVVAMLAKQYTGIESSSVTYEKANQLMEAVIYAIREVENSGEALLAKQEQNAMQSYKTGAKLVRKKTEELLKYYETQKNDFCAYGNAILEDFWQKGIIRFFQYYDEKFEPQNTLLALAYPVFADLSEVCGIDCMDLYVRSLAAEQQFLAKFGEDYVRMVLSAYHADYGEISENMAGIVFGNVIGHLLVEKRLAERLCEGDLQRIYDFSASLGKDSLKEKIIEAAEIFLQQHYDGGEQVLSYMMKGLPDICARIGNAVAYGHLDKIFVF